MFGDVVRRNTQQRETDGMDSAERKSAKSVGLLTIEQAAQCLSISNRSMRGLLEQGAIPYVKVTARRIAIDGRDLDAYVSRQRVAAPRA